MLTSAAAAELRVPSAESVSWYRQPALWLPVLVLLGLAAGAAPPLYSAAAVLGIAGLIVIVIRPEVGLYLVTLSVPFQSLRGSDPTEVQITSTEILVGLTAAAFLIRQLVLQRGSSESGPLVRPIAIFIGAVLLSAFKATNQLQSLKELVKWLELLAVYWMTINLIKDKRQVIALLTMTTVGALAETAIGAAQVLLRIGPPEFLIGGVILRAYGTFGQPNPLAGYLNMTLPILIAVGVFSTSRKVQCLCWLASAGIGAIMVITLSRGAWLGLAAALMVMGLVMSVRVAFWIRFALLGLSFVILAAVFGIIPFSLTARVLAAFGLSGVSLDSVTAENFSAVQRIAFWQAGLNMFNANPILGVGIGNYMEAYPTYAAPGWNEVLGHAHDYYLNVAAEAGMVGLVGYLALVVAAFRHLLQTVRSLPSGVWYGVALGLLGMFTAISVHNLVDNMYVHGMPVLLGLLLGAASVIHRWSTGGGGKSSPRPQWRQDKQSLTLVARRPRFWPGGESHH